MARKSRPPAARGLRTRDFERLASFRQALRRFLHFSESAAAAVGLTGQHYQAMLAVRAAARRGPLTINGLAGELLIKHNSAVGLVDRLAVQNLLARERSAHDRRKVHLRLTRKGDRILERLASVHRRELRGASRMLAQVLREIAGLPR